MENANFGEQPPPSTNSVAAASQQYSSNPNYYDSRNNYDLGSSYQQQSYQQQYPSWGDAADDYSSSSAVPAKSGDYTYGYNTNGGNGGEVPLGMSAESENSPYSSPQQQQQYSNNSRSTAYAYGTTAQNFNSSNEKSNLLGKIKNFGATALTKVHRKVGTYEDLDDGGDNGGYTDLHGISGGGGGGGEYGGHSATRHMISAMQAGWNVTNAIQGMFIVSFPYAVLNGGYWALIAIVFFAYICCHTGKVLVQCLYEPNQDGIMVRVRSSYGDIAERVWGKKWGHPIVNAAQLIELLMTCILYVVLCGDLMAYAFPGSWQPTTWMVFATFCLIPCAFLKDLRAVSETSFWCTIAHIIINAIILGYCLLRIGDWKWGEVQTNFDFKKFPTVLGIVVFSYTSQIFLPTLEGNMRRPEEFNHMLDVSHIAAAFFKALFALVGFLTFGAETEQEITNNLPTPGFKAIVNLVLVCKALLSYPLPYFAAVELVESSLFRGQVKKLEKYALRDEQTNRVNRNGYVVRLLVILSTLIMAVTLPRFALLMGLIGSFTGTALSFIWPCYFHLRIKWDTLEWRAVLIDTLSIGLGLVCGFVGIIFSSFNLIESFMDEELTPPIVEAIRVHTGVANFSADAIGGADGVSMHHSHHPHHYGNRSMGDVLAAAGGSLRGASPRH